MITAEEAASKIRSKVHLHEALVRSGKAIPSSKSPICTVEFLHEVRRGDTFCPNIADIRLKPCAKPPSRTKT